MTGVLPQHKEVTGVLPQHPVDKEVTGVLPKHAAMNLRQSFIALGGQAHGASSAVSLSGVAEDDSQGGPLGANQDTHLHTLKRSFELLHAAVKDDAERVRTLLSEPGEQSFINYTEDENGYTPLFLAAVLQNDSVTEQLIVARCNLDLRANDGRTPLFAAADKGHASVTEHLIVARCNVDLQNDSGLSPLHIAACRGHAAVTEQLIAARCTINLQESKAGWTALHGAATHGHEAVVK